MINPMWGRYNIDYHKYRWARIQRGLVGDIWNWNAWPPYRTPPAGLSYYFTTVSWIFDK